MLATLFLSIFLSLSFSLSLSLSLSCFVVHLSSSHFLFTVCTATSFVGITLSPFFHFCLHVGRKRVLDWVRVVLLAMHLSKKN